MGEGGNIRREDEGRKPLKYKNMKVKYRRKERERENLEGTGETTGCGRLRRGKK